MPAWQQQPDDVMGQVNNNDRREQRSRARRAMLSEAREREKVSERESKVGDSREVAEFRSRSQYPRCTATFEKAVTNCSSACVRERQAPPSTSIPRGWRRLVESFGELPTPALSLCLRSLVAAPFARSIFATPLCRFAAAFLFTHDACIPFRRWSPCTRIASITTSSPRA